MINLRLGPKYTLHIRFGIIGVLFVFYFWVENLDFENKKMKTGREVL